VIFGNKKYLKQWPKQANSERRRASERFRWGWDLSAAFLRTL